MSTSIEITVEDIARACHEANRALCVAVGDQSQKHWEEAEQWQRDSAVAGVKFRLVNPKALPDAQHKAWCVDKVKSGWKYGPIKNAETKEHHCLVPFAALPLEQQAKDHLFIKIVDSLCHLLVQEHERD